MNLLDEFKKALEGKPSKVKLADAPESYLLRERKLRDKGYRFSFGTNFKNREKLIESLPPHD